MSNAEFLEKNLDKLCYSGWVIQPVTFELRGSPLKYAGKSRDIPLSINSAGHRMMQKNVPSFSS